MKDFVNFIEFLTSRRYSAVSSNINNANVENEDKNNTLQRRNIRRSSSVVVNRFFADTVLTEKRKHSRRAACFMIFGVLSIVMGSYIVLADPYNLLFNWKIMFSDGGETFLLWKKPPVELLFKAYIFNITNPDAFLRGEEKLKVEQIGPYIYREVIEHANVTFNDNGTVSEVPLHPLVWEPAFNNLTEDDIVTVPHVALLSIANFVRDSSYFTRMGLNLLIRQTDSNPLVQMTVKEFMFGYKSRLISIGHAALSSWIYFDKIGVVDRMYDFGGDYATVFTGEGDVRKTGLTDTYRGSKYIEHWYHNESCKKASMVSGTTDSTKFPARIQPNDTLIFYRKSICRIMPMERTGETLFSGLKAYTYTWRKGILDNGARNPENKCYCRHGQCLQEGLIDVADCYYGFPIVLSYPHFYQGDPALVEAVEGLSPNAEEHGSYFIIQPETGIPLSISTRTQINLGIGDISRISRVERFSNMVFPLMWTDIGMAKLPDHLISRFYLYVNVAPVVFQVSMYVFFVIGPFLLACSVVRVFRKTWEDRKNNEDEESYSKRHMSFIHDDRRASFRAKEVDIYMSSLLMSSSGEVDRSCTVKGRLMDEDNV